MKESLNIKIYFQNMQLKANCIDHSDLMMYPDLLLVFGGQREFSVFLSVCPGNECHQFTVIINYWKFSCQHPNKSKVSMTKLNSSDFVILVFFE